MDHKSVSFFLLCSFVSMIALGQAGCLARNTVIATTGTSIGVEITQDPSTGGTPRAKLGYQRVELALVPTNKGPRKKTVDVNGKKELVEQTGGAEESTPVLMELKYAGIFSWGASGGIYQRLAVGEDAVKQRGAAFMFLRDTSGDGGPSTEDLQKSFTSEDEKGKAEAEAEKAKADAKRSLIEAPRKMEVAKGATLLIEQMRKDGIGKEGSNIAEIERIELYRRVTEVLEKAAE